MKNSIKIKVKVSKFAIWYVKSLIIAHRLFKLIGLNLAIDQDKAAEKIINMISLEIVQSGSDKPAN